MFLVKQVEGPEEASLHAALRYQVYCLEKGWLDPDDYPNGEETDKYDAHSVLFVALAASMTDECAGTIRLIRDGQWPLPVEDHFGISMPKGETSGEISRLTVAQPYRTSERGLLLGLCRAIYDELVTGGFDTVYAILERPLYLVFRAIGFPFESLAESRPVWGAATMPCRCQVEQIIPSLKKRDSKTGLGLADYFEMPFDGIVKGE